ncbi:hypothetical protein HUU05_25560, partial [candidate division KSB1 bacterium]|nr:hypothetical protein [candidate division KSB1 bacterium]
MIPIYSELFSHEAEVTSENEKILHVVDAVVPACAKDAHCIHDRSDDCEALPDAHFAAGHQFIVRQTGARHLYFDGKNQGFDFFTRRARSKWAYNVERIHQNRIRKRTYDCGALRVSLEKNGKSSRLVVMKGRDGGYCWLLYYFKDCRSTKQAVELPLKGYGLRWKIEEVHREIKVDYKLEAMRVERY